jgi:hypothetical protein
MVDKTENQTEFEEAFADIKKDIKDGQRMFTFFGSLTVLLKLFLKIPLSWAVPLIIFIWFSIYFFYLFLIKKITDLKTLYNFHFGYTIVDNLLLTTIIHYLGGIEWIGILFYILTILHMGLIQTKKRALLVSFGVFILYTSLVLLECSGIIPHRELFSPRPGFYQDKAYIITTLIAGALGVFYFVADLSSSFSERLRKKRKETINAYKEAEEAKTVLEIKVRARTRELEELTKKLDEEVKEKTKALQLKIEELERFNKLVVARELKMVELKKEIEKLKEELEKSKLKNE